MKVNIGASNQITLLKVAFYCVQIVHLESTAVFDDVFRLLQIIGRVVRDLW